MTHSITVTFWGDLICPICPIGHAKLKAAIEQFPHKDDVEIVYRSSRLRPGVAPHTVESYLRQKYGADSDVAAILGQVEQMGADAGLTYRMAKTLAGDTLDAHRVVHLARSEGLQLQMVERLHQGHFAEEANIFDKDTLVRLAGEVGLDRSRVTAMLASDEFKKEVEADETAAAQVGASSVPYFLFNGQLPVCDEDRREQLPAILDQAWKVQTGTAHPRLQEAEL